MRQPPIRSGFVTPELVERFGDDILDFDGSISDRPDSHLKANPVLMNLYGDDTQYKPFPDIGEPIRSDGLVYSVRECMEAVDPTTLVEPDLVYDGMLFAPPGKPFELSDIHGGRALALKLFPDLESIVTDPKVIKELNIRIYKKYSGKPETASKGGFKLNNLHGGRGMVVNLFEDDEFALSDDKTIEEINKVIYDAYSGKSESDE